MTKKNLGSNETINVEVAGETLLKQHYGGRSMIHCLVELLNNARDWKATAIAVITKMKDRLVIVDNGDGMNTECRKSFVSLAHSAAKKQTGMHGRFGEGSKYLFFSFANCITVRTAPKEDANQVYTFTFTVEEYIRLVFDRGHVQATCTPKTQATWPYAHPFGTELTYALRDPKSQTVRRGEVLGRELSDRLPTAFEHIVTVDDARLPPKRIIGKKYEFEGTHQELGDIRVELYRPAKGSPKDTLLFTGNEIGEVHRRDFISAIGDLSERFPGLLLLSDVCGTIAASFLRDFAHEDRKSFMSAIADDRRTLLLLRFLEKLLPDIEKTIGLAVERRSSATQGVSVVQERFEKLYGTKTLPIGEMHPTIENDGAQEDEEDVDVVPRTLSAIHLVNSRPECGVGETVDLYAYLREDIGKQHAFKDLQWSDGEPYAQRANEIKNGYRFLGKQLGTCTITVSLRGTPFTAKISFEVVKERKFCVTPVFKEIVIGRTMRIFANNTDRLLGEPQWQMFDGRGELKIASDGRSATFHATHAGTTRIRVWDEEAARTNAVTEVNVLATATKLFPVRDDWFVTKSMIGSLNDGSSPIQMTRATPYSFLMVHENHPGLVQARQRGEDGEFLVHAILLEHARFRFFDADAAKKLSNIRDSEDAHARIMQYYYEGLLELLMKKE